MKPAIHAAICAGFLYLLPAVGAEEILLHTVPPVSIPVSSLLSRDLDAEELHFSRNFFIESSRIARLPAIHVPPTPPPVDAQRALALAKSSLVPSSASRGFSLVKQELLTTRVGDLEPVEYYLIEMLANGSNEFRVVLMDGTILRPRLERVRRD